jgi:malonate transporter
MINLPLIFGALGPIFALILLGLSLRRLRVSRRRVLAGGGAPHLFHPVSSLADAAIWRWPGSADYAVLPVAAVVAVALLLGYDLGWSMPAAIVAEWWTGRAFTSVYQGAIRFQHLCGAGGGAGGVQRRGWRGCGAGDGDHDSVDQRTLRVGAERCTPAARRRSAASLRGLSTNPLILACLAGIGLNVSRDRLAVGIGGGAGDSGANGAAAGIAGGGRGIADGGDSTRPGLLAAA